jgi:hypothetical protein
MTAPAKHSDSTAVATREAKPRPAEIQSVIDDNKARNQVVAAIRGTQWGRDCTPEMARAVAQYCRENNLDPVRHVEILGGRIYLTAELYDEKGAHLIRSGEVQPDEADYINADERLDKLANDGDEWAIAERTRRIRERIRHNVPDKAVAAVVQRFIIRASGKPIIGVNWCGGGSRKSDPVGDAEPTKTAATRARRRAWKQIADVIPAYAEAIRPIEASARIINESLPVAVVDSKALPARSTNGASMQAVHGYDGDDSPMGQVASPQRINTGDARDIDDDTELLAEAREIQRQDAEADGELALGNTRRTRRQTD